MRALVIANLSVTRLLRDKSNIFYVFLLPMMLILVLGFAFGGRFEARVGVLATDAGPLGREIADEIAAVEAIEASVWDDREALVRAVERGRLHAAVLIPEGYDDRLAAGESVEIEFVTQPGGMAQTLRNTIEPVVIEQGALLRAAGMAVARGGATHDAAVSTAREKAGEVASIEVVAEVAGEASPFEQLGQFQLGAYSQLLFFVYITSLTGSMSLIESRRLGVLTRMLATPTSVRTVLIGESLGRLAIALVQGVFIMLGTALVFGVDWGDPLGAALVLLVFSLGAAGAGMLMGAMLRNESQAGGVGVILSMGLGAIGGTMVPLTVMKEIAPTLYQIAHITPHAWGVRAFEKLILLGGGVPDILLELTVLAMFALIAYALGVWRLRIALTQR